MVLCAYDLKLNFTFNNIPSTVLKKIFRTVQT